MSGLHKWSDKAPIILQKCVAGPPLHMAAVVRIIMMMMFGFSPLFSDIVLTAESIKLLEK